MAGPKFRHKNSEVEALQVNQENLGSILSRLQTYSEEAITFNVTFPEGIPFAVTADTFEVELLFEESDYVVFTASDYDIMSEGQFNEIFEPVPAEVTTQEWYYPPGQTPPPGWTPYQPKSPFPGTLPYEQAIVLD